MKRILLVLSATILAMALLTSCEDEEKNAANGKKAAVEFCDCLDKGNSKSECESALTGKYSKSEYTSDDFIKAFNEEGKSCGVTISKIYTKDQPSVVRYIE